MESSTSSSSLHVASWLWSHSFVVSSVQLYCHKIHHSFIVFKCSTHEPNTATGTQLFFCPDSLFAFHSFSFLRLLLLEILFWRQRRPFLAILFIRQLESNAVLTHAEHRTLNWTAEMPFLMSLGLLFIFIFFIFSHAVPSSSLCGPVVRWWRWLVNITAFIYSVKRQFLSCRCRCQN